MSGFYTLKWVKNSLRIIDQRRLPLKERYLSLRTHSQVIKAIKNLSIRGAPAIGVAGAFGAVLGALKLKTEDLKRFKLEFSRICEEIKNARPTAVNLSWGVQRLEKLLLNSSVKSVAEAKRLLLEEAKKIAEEDIKCNIKIGDFGETLVPPKAKVLTHCNAGALATTGYGTALGVIRSAFKKGKIERVFIDETRPVLQGARLTAWELKKDGIPVTVITDNMAGALMKKGEVTLVVVGADRITARGDVANKIGTYSLAILANYHHIPFYVAAPKSTFDLGILSGDDIIIEMRDQREVLNFNGKRIAPSGVDGWNPAFDVTPGELITAIITERGIINPPFKENILKVISS